MGIAMRVKAEGNEVLFFIRDLKSVDIGRGLITKPYEWKHAPIDYDTIIVSDCVGIGIELDMLRAAGYLVVGGAEFADKLEMDRLYTYSIFEECGIPVSPYEEFDNFDIARELVESLGDEDRLVFKPCGESSGIVPSHVSKNKQDMLEFLNVAPGLMSGGHTFILQEFVEGVDLSTEGWFDGTRFLRPFNHTIESKKFLAGNMGPTVGCAGNVVWSCEDEYCEQTLLRVEKFLAGKGYIGPVDINVIVAPNGEISGLEFCPRFGYDATPTLFTMLYEGDIGQFFSDLARKQITEMPLHNKIAAGIRMSISPYPSHGGEVPTNIHIEGLGKLPYKDFHCYGVMLNEEKKPVVASHSVGVACGIGDNIESAMKAANKRAKEVDYTDKQYRNDLAETFTEIYDKL